MKKRLNFQCWNCDRDYAMIRELDGKPQLIVACPYCEKEAVVDLKPFQTQVATVYRGGGEATSNVVEGYNFPDVIPTVPVNDKM